MTVAVQRYPGQIAPYRNPGFAQPKYPTGQGLVQAAFINGSDGSLYSLTQATLGDWAVGPQPLADGVQQVVAAVALQSSGPPMVTDVNLFWSTGSGISTTSLASASQWSSPLPVTALPTNLSWLQVAYTPAGNPVVYGVDPSNDLWTYNWSGSGWTATKYPASSLGWATQGNVGHGTAGNVTQGGFTLLAQTETSWTVFAGSATANELVAVQGAFGGGVTGSFSYGTPQSGGYIWIIGGGLSQPTPSPNPSGPCAFYISSATNVVMWPNSRPNDVAVPTYTDAGQTVSLNLPPTVTVNAFPNPDGRNASGFTKAGSGTTFYQADDHGNVLVMRQLAWVFDNQLPYFSPPCLIASNLPTLPAVGVAPLPRPMDVPAVFVIDNAGNVYEFELNGSRGTWNGQIAQDQWSGGQITA